MARVLINAKLIKETEKSRYDQLVIDLVLLYGVTYHYKKYVHKPFTLSLLFLSSPPTPETKTSPKFQLGQAYHTDELPETWTRQNW